MRYAALALFLAASPPLAAAPSPQGVWRTQPGPKGGSMNVEVAPCGGAGETLCGVVVGTFNMNRPDLMGITLIRDMVPDGEGGWSGEIYAPDKGTFDSRMQIEGSELKVEGCMLTICRSQIWSRVE